MTTYSDRALGALAGAAVGDALGGAAEGNTPADIQAALRRLRRPGIVPPFHEDWRNARPIAAVPQGRRAHHRRHVDDARPVDVYAAVRDHLDAYAVAEHLVPLLIGERRWIPELETEALLLQRIFLAEKWLVARLHYGHVDPREAGVGNIVNCGAAMYMTPVGIVNAADPAGAYAEAIDIAGAHQSSYGREAAGVFAAAVAEAMRPGRRSTSVVETAIGVAHDGTRAAIEAVAPIAAEARRLARRPRAICARRSPRSTRSARTTAQPALDARLPSRTKSIEELPVALGFAVVAGGDYRDAVLGAVNYGRDSDSIATMAGAITGALGGAAVRPGRLARRGGDGEPDRPRRAGGDAGRRGARRSGASDAERRRGAATRHAPRLQR